MSFTILCHPNRLNMPRCGMLGRNQYTIAVNKRPLFAIAASINPTIFHLQVIWHGDPSGHGNHARYGFGVIHCQNLEKFLRLF
jgi:hypothetical protein